MHNLIKVFAQNPRIEQIQKEINQELRDLYDDPQEFDELQVKLKELMHENQKPFQLDFFTFVNHEHILFALFELLNEIHLAYYHDYCTIHSIPMPKDIQIVRKVLQSQEIISFNTQTTDPLHFLKVHVLQELINDPVNTIKKLTWE